MRIDILERLRLWPMVLHYNLEFFIVILLIKFDHWAWLASLKEDLRLAILAFDNIWVFPLYLEENLVLLIDFHRHDTEASIWICANNLDYSCLTLLRTRIVFVIVNHRLKVPLKFFLLLFLFDDGFIQRRILLFVVSLLRAWKSYERSDAQVRGIVLYAIIADFTWVSLIQDTLSPRIIRNTMQLIRESSGGTWGWTAWLMRQFGCVAARAAGVNWLDTTISVTYLGDNSSRFHITFLNIICLHHLRLPLEEQLNLDIETDVFVNDHRLKKV